MTWISVSIPYNFAPVVRACNSLGNLLFIELAQQRLSFNQAEVMGRERIQQFSLLEDFLHEAPCGGIIIDEQYSLQAARNPARLARSKSVEPF